MIYQNFMKIKAFITIAIIILFQTQLFADEQNKIISKLYSSEWTVNCSSENNKECNIERSVFTNQEMKNKLITIIMKTKLPSKEVRFILISPLGTLIPSGVRIGFDGKFMSKNGYSFNICRKIGCITSMMVKKETLEKFKKAENLNLEYVGPNGQKINIDFPLDGFTKEFQKISKT